MIKNQFVNQKKQKILNYQIKMIQKCSDSLFTEVNCNHERYLGWNLGQSLKNLLQNYHYKFRWIGNDCNSYVYAYFYIVIVGCASQPNCMLQLKMVLYELGRKYLAQYEQKLLIQFLCLIEYSQDKFMFFRNYSKIQVILLKLFKQIETRNSLTAFSTKDFKQQDNTISKLGTQFTSPTKSKMSDETSKLLRNSDYYNSSIKRIEMEYRADLVKREKKLSNYNKINFIHWYQCYGTIFKFMKMTVLSQQNVKFQISNPTKEKCNQEFIITTEKGCFFVIQMVNIERYSNQQQQVRSDKSGSILDQQRNYLNSLIERELKQTKIKKEYIDFTKSKNKNESLLFTPKFISNKKKLSLVGNDLYNDDSLTKNIQIQVLNVSQFNENKVSQVKIKNEEQKTYDFYKSKVNNLDKIKSTIKSIHQEKDNQQQPIQKKNFPLFNFLRNSNKVIKTEQHINNHEFNNLNDSKRLQFSSHQQIPTGRNYQTEPNDMKLGRPKQENRGTFNEGIKNQTLPIIRNNPQMKEINVNNISSIPANETILSAVNIKKRYNIGNEFRKNLFECDNKRISPREVQSYSPPNHLMEVRPVHFYSPNRVMLTENSIHRPNCPRQIKFTYL